MGGRRMSELAHIKNKLHGRKAGILNQKSHPDAAVLLPLVYEGGELCVLFEVRAHHLNSQPSEICFPGGRIDPTDVSPKAVAIRECSEELGLPKSDIQAIAPLDIVVTPFRGIIFPFVATIKDIQAIKINDNEVDHIFTIPLSSLYTYE